MNRLANGVGVASGRTLQLALEPRWQGYLNGPRLIVLPSVLVAGLAALAIAAGFDPVAPGLLTLFTPIALYCLRTMSRTVLRSFAVFTPYMSLWLVFWFLRGHADETPLVDATRTWIWDLERWLTGGELLNARLQDWLLDPAQPGLHDGFFTVIYASFFLVQLVLAVTLGFTNWSRIARYLLTVTMILGVGVVLHYLLPTNPPWMAPEGAREAAAGAPGHVYRVTMLQSGMGADQGVSLDKNQLAAMPSIHMAMTLMLVFVSRWFARPWRILALVYLAVMTFALVYLGEHFVIDELAGVVLTVAAWWASSLTVRRLGPSFEEWRRIHWTQATVAGRPSVLKS